MPPTRNDPESLLLAAAIRVATEAHAGQVDKCGQPYILHPLRVMLRCRDPDDRIVAVLHDVIEDADDSVDALNRIIVALSPHASTGTRIMNICYDLDALTRRGGESYHEFIGRIAKGSSLRAVRVKIADLEDNTDPARLPADEDDALALYEMTRSRYEPALARLRRTLEA